MNGMYPVYEDGPCGCLTDFWLSGETVSGQCYEKLAGGTCAIPCSDDEEFGYFGSVFFSSPYLSGF